MPADAAAHRLPRPDAPPYASSVSHRTLQRVTRETPFARWETVVREPAAALAPHASPYQGYREVTSGTPPRQVHVPFGGVPVIITLESPLMQFEFGQPDSTPVPLRAFIAGMHDRSAMTQSAGDAAGIQVNLTPLGAYELFGAPMHLFANRCIELEDVWGVEATELQERLLATDDWAARFDIVDEALMRRLAHARRASEAVAWAWHQLRASGGRVPVSRLTDELNWSRKRLGEAFREEIGLSPKTVARVLRFQRATSLLALTPDTDAASLAVACGYYDQSHMIRDFRQFAGVTPGEYAATLVPDGGFVNA